MKLKPPALTPCATCFGFIVPGVQDWVWVEDFLIALLQDRLSVHLPKPTMHLPCITLFVRDSAGVTKSSDAKPQTLNLHLNPAQNLAEDRRSATANSGPGGPLPELLWGIELGGFVFVFACFGS